MSQDTSTKPPAGGIPSSQAGPTGKKLMIELAPLILFFIAYSRFDIYTATSVLMVATVASLIASKILLGKL